MTASDDDALNRRLAALDERLAVQRVPTLAAFTSSSRELIANVALTGAFDLGQLARQATPGERGALVAHLSDISELVSESGGLHRRLFIGPRRQTLEALLADNVLTRKVLEHYKPEKNDLEGQFSAQLLRGWQPQLSMLSNTELQSLAVVAGWFQGLAGTDLQIELPDARQVQYEIANRTREQELQSLLGEGLIGREKELHELQFFAIDPQNARRITIISGEGGIGKSSLLAALTQALSAHNPSMPIVHFDFDRPSLDPEGPGLSLELTRQLARYFPAAQNILSELRSHFKRSFRERTGRRYGMGSTREHTLSSNMETSSSAKSIIRQLKLHERPILMILDTFEMLAGRGDESLRALVEWLDIVWDDFDMRGMRVLVAGRAAENVARPLVGWATEQLNLLPLALHHACALLIREGLDRTKAVSVAKVLDGNPLVLRLVGRYLTAHPEQIEGFVKEAAGLDKALGPGILYSRILNRIGSGESDPLRKLAYPGLILRVVTPGLLQDVLAPNVLRTELEHDEVENLFKRLRQQAWLVDEQSERLVRHRKDLRKVTLELLRKDPLLGPLAQMLHREAIEYLLEDCDPDLSTEQANQEIVYHRLMTLQSPNQLDQQEQPLVKQAMAGDFSELTHYAAALARAYCQMPPLLEDLAVLPGELGRVATAELAWALIDADRPEETLALPTPGFAPVWWLTAQHDLVRWNAPAETKKLAKFDKAFRGIPSSSREHHQLAFAVSSFLKLWRQEFLSIPKPSEILRTLEHRRGLRTAGWLRAMVAWGIGALQQGKNVDQEWAVMYSFLTHTPDDSPPAAYEKARLWILLWAAGHASRDDAFVVHGDALSLDSHSLSKLERLCDVVPGSYELRSCLREIRSQDIELEQVALYTRQLADAITQCQANRLGFFMIAGFSPNDLLSGLMGELRTPTRQLISNALADPGQRQAAHDYFNKLIAEVLDKPARLKIDLWFTKRRKGSRIRVLIPFVEWLGRMHLASEVCSMFEHICTGASSRQFHQLAQAWRQVEVLEGSPSPPKPERFQGPSF